MIENDYKELIRDFISLIHNVNIDTGTCCCGDSMDSHSYGCNHSPRDMGEYAATSLEERAIKLLTIDRNSLMHYNPIWYPTT